MERIPRKRLTIFLSVFALSLMVIYGVFVDFERSRILLEYAFTLALLYFAYLQSSYTSMQYEILKKTTQPIIYIRTNECENIIIENSSTFPIFSVIMYGYEYKTDENEHFFDMIDIIYPQTKVTLETPSKWRKTMVVDLTISYCLGGQKGERESKRELVFLNALETGNDPEKEIEQIKEILPDLLETSDMIQDILRETIEKS